MKTKNPFWKRLVILSILLIPFIPLSVKAQDDGSYSLEECINIAFEKNLTIQRSQLDLKVSEVNRSQSKMERLPDFNMGSNYSNNWGRSIDPTTNQFITSQNNSANINGRSNLTLFKGMQINNTIKQNNVNYAASVQDLEKSKNDVALNVATLYLNVLFNEELLENANYQLNSTNQQMERTKKMVDAGALPITNLLDLTAQSASNQVQVINAENNYNLAILNLKQALLIPASDPFRIEVPQMEIEADAEISNAAQIYEAAETIMPEVKSADLRIEEADLNYKIAKGAYAPSLTLSGGFNSNYSSIANKERNIYDGTSTIIRQIGYVEGTNENVLSQATIPNIVDTKPDFGAGEQFKENISKNVSVNLTIPIFNRFRTRANVQKSMLTKYRAEITSHEVRNQLRQNIESAYYDMTAALHTHDANLKQVEALQEAFRVTENQYNLGAVNFVDYQVANNNLYGAKSDLVRSKFDFIFKQKILDFYLGKPLSF